MVAGPSNNATKSPLSAVQYLRATAALMVACFHTCGQIPAYFPFYRRSLFGSETLSAGVDIFFVISGFIMLMSSRNMAPGEFMKRRIVRVVPLYWALTSLLAIIVLLRPELMRTTAVSWEFYFKSLFFIPYANPGHNGDLVPLLVPGWSLNFEMFFYAVFALVLFAPHGRRVLIVGATFLVLAVVGYASRDSTSYRELLFLCEPKILEFWLGMLIAHFYLRGKLNFGVWIPWVLLICGFAALLWHVPLPPALANGVIANLVQIMLPAAAIVLGTVAFESTRRVPHVGFLMFLGDASYSLYLSHIFSLGAARFLWVRMGLGQVTTIRAVEFAVFSMILVLLGTVLVYKCFERPALILLLRLTGRREAAKNMARASHSIP
jgi:exopolysaccharide production protein ExoZ